MEKKKITEIPLKVKQNVYIKNEMGQRVPVEKEVTVFKEIECVSGWTRFGHYLIDVAAYYAFVILVLVIFGFLSGLFSWEIDFESRQFDVFIRIAGYLVLHPFFYFFWEFFFQKTPGKWVTKCRVVNEYGEKPSLGQILGRSYARCIPFEAFSCFSERGWHDTMSKTYLVKETHLAELKAIMMIDEIGSGKVDLPDENLQPGF